MSSTESIQAHIQRIIRSYANDATNLVQMLWRIQEKYSYIPETAIEHLASELNLPHAHIAGVAGFYSFFYDTPRGQYNILFSDNITDHLLGKQEVMNHLMKKLGVKLGQPRSDGRVTVDNTACIGMSDQGPAALINGQTITRLNKIKIDQMVDLIEAQTPLSEWPEEFFKVRNNIQRKHILLGEYFEPGAAIKVLLERGPEAILTELNHSGLRGCGGAGFKTETKWTLCRNTPAEARYVVCNADEGEPGTFKDRIIMQSYADLMFEGMTLCAGIIGAKKGFLYLRGEYRYLLEPLKAVLARRRQQGLLGERILGRPDFSFDIDIHLGAGAYVCGAEIALIESLQGHRGVPLRRPPPFPVTEGYLGQPTVVNNVETLALAAKIATYGGKRFAKLGTKHSKGTKLLSVCGDCDRPGVYEFPFGVTIQEVLDACGAQDTQAVQNSGPAGRCLSAADFDKRLCFEALNTTGSIMIFNQQRNILEIVRNFAQFFVHESCGFCTPCRIGTSLLKNLIEKVHQGNGTQSDLEELAHLSQIIKTTSHCGLGMTSANHIEDTLAKFPSIYNERLKESTTLVPAFNLDAALEEAREITHRTDDASAHW